MSRKPYYTSNTLIEAVKRKMSFPIAQVTFSEDDILAFADEEMFLSQVPSILQFHEEYLVYEQESALVANQSRYPVPSRAIGMRLRDLFYRDNSNQIVEMSRINPDDRALFDRDSNSFPTPIHYYIQNNHIVIIPTVGASPTGTLIFSYYLRPNSLVTDDRAAVCQSFSKTITVENADLVAGDILTFGDEEAVADTDFAIGANSSITASNLANYIATLTSTQFTSDVANNIVTLFYMQRSTSVSSTSTGLTVQATITLQTSDVPSDVVAGTMIDLLQTEAGHNTLAIDVLLAQGSVSPTSITLSESQLPSDFVIGDYACAQYECIIPQVPTDLHNLLAERTCARIMEALGDKEGLAAANAKIGELEIRQGTILDNRIEGSPQKILNRNGLLKGGRMYHGRRS